MKYLVVLEPTDEGYAVSVPSLPNCHSQGRTEQEALTKIGTAIQEHLTSITERYKNAQTRFVEVELTSTIESESEGEDDLLRYRDSLEIRKLPREKQAAVLRAQAAAAEHEYRTNPELTALEAFGEEDGPFDAEPR